MKLNRTLALLLASAIALFSLTACMDTVEDVLDIGIALLEEESENLTGETTAAVREVTTEPETTKTPETTRAPETTAPAPAIDENGSYYSREEVALYLWTYKRLPDNFITKTEARRLGWEGGSVERYKDGAAIGGDRFGNYEGVLPEDEEYRECDIDTDGESSRGAKRIVYTEDCSAIYYTDDHYESFTQLYPEED